MFTLFHFLFVKKTCSSARSADIAPARHVNSAAQGTSHTQTPWFEGAYTQTHASEFHELRNETLKQILKMNENVIYDFGVL